MKNRLKQSNKRKNACPHYCEKHQMHYINNCVFCWYEKHGLKVSVIDLDEGENNEG